MTERQSVPGQSPEQRTEELKRRHTEARRREKRSRRVRLAIIVAAAVVVIAAVGVVAAKALGPDGPPKPSPSAAARSGSPGPTATVTVVAVDSAAPSPPGTVGQTPPATPTGEPEPTPTVTPAGSPAATPQPEPAPRFRAAAALADVRALADVGVRSGGSAAETRGAEYIAARLQAAGIEAKIRTFALTNGKTSRNVIGTVPGSTAKTIILGAHMDSKAPSPGANDNGSGCGALLELGRCLTKRAAYPTVKLVFFGTEEMIDADPDHHHFGSRSFVQTMSRTARKNAAGMISVDMIGYGPDFVVRTMGVGPQTLRYQLLAAARREHLKMSYLQDPGPSGYSDHEAFERDQIPAAWIEWRDDPVYHTAADTSSHLVKAKMQTTGSFLLDFLYGMDEARLEKLAS